MKVSIQSVGVCMCVHMSVCVCVSVYTSAWLCVHACVCARVTCASKHVCMRLYVCGMCVLVSVCFHHLLITPDLWGFNPRAHICLKRVPRGLAAVSSKPKDTGVFTRAAF